MIDTGSSDTVLPMTGLNNFPGPTIDFTPASKQQTETSYYGDGSNWTGYETRLNMTFGNSTGLAPVFLMNMQSTNPLFSNGIEYDGLMGFAYPVLSKATTEPRTVMDAFYQSKVFQKNQVAFHGCPYDRVQHAWMDIGNETPFNGCGDVPVTISLSEKFYINIELQKVHVNNVPFNVSTSSLRILDSCSSIIFMDPTIVTNLKKQIYMSGGLANWFNTSTYRDSFFDAARMINVPSDTFDYNLLPSITFDILDPKTEGVLSLVLGPRQYLQRDLNDYYYFLVKASGTMSILGLPFFSAYHILLDREEGTLTFRQGCLCNSTDGYPKILMSTGSIASASQSVIATSTTNTIAIISNQTPASTPPSTTTTITPPPNSAATIATTAFTSANNTPTTTTKLSSSTKNYPLLPLFLATLDLIF
jgi:hypothetical protein